MSEYVPTTEEVRDDYAHFQVPGGTAPVTGEFAEGRAEFDRWLAAHDAEVAAKAWDEGALAAWDRSTPTVNGTHYHWRSQGEPENPYRKAVQS